MGILRASGATLLDWPPLQLSTGLATLTGRAAFGETSYGNSSYASSLRIGDTKCICARKDSQERELLFGLSADPGEKGGISGRDRALTEKMKSEMTRTLQAVKQEILKTEDVVVDHDTEERLRALGYID
jgi:hypothetical protein